MVRGIESAASGMLSNIELNDIIANNLANINTPGFKQTLATFKNIDNVNVQNVDVSEGYSKYSAPIGNLSAGTTLDSTVFDFKQGTLKVTGNPLDLAIRGDGFFTVQTPTGEAYTRNGSFIRNEKGQITTSDGYTLIGRDSSGKRGPITVNGEVQNIKVNGNGSLVVDGKVLSKLEISDFRNKSTLEQQGNCMYKVANGQPNTRVASQNFEITQGSVEGSNANVVECMVNSINCSRAYDMMAKSLETNNKTLTKTVNEVGRIKR